MEGSKRVASFRSPSGLFRLLSPPARRRSDGRFTGPRTAKSFLNRQDRQGAKKPRSPRNKAPRKMSPEAEKPPDGSSCHRSRVERKKPRNQRARTQRDRGGVVSFCRYSYRFARIGGFLCLRFGERLPLSSNSSWRLGGFFNSATLQASWIYRAGELQSLFSRTLVFSSP